MTQSLLMCSPQYFDVQYVINPWMAGQIGKVNPSQARREWSEFYNTVAGLANVKLIEPQPHVPDMVFTANAGLLRGKTFLPSRFRYDQRRPEEPCFKSWFESNGYRIVELPGDLRFEGAGDALFQPNGNVLWAAYGFRSDRQAHDVLANLYGIKVISLRLINPRFYHLDTCFCPLLANRVMYYPAAFDPASVKLIEKYSENNITVSDEDAGHFACNAVLAGKTLVMSHPSPDLKLRLEQAGYLVMTAPVPEFLKAGGANKCLTMTLDDPFEAENLKHAA